MTQKREPWSWISTAGWLLAGLAVLISIAVLALSRGEPVNALWLVVASVCVFASAWRFHSVWLMAKVLTLNDGRYRLVSAWQPGQSGITVSGRQFDRGEG